MGEHRALGTRSRALLPFRYGGSAIANWRWLSTVWNAPVGSVLQRLIKARPEMWNLLQVPFLTTAWTTGTRFARLVDHCRIVEAMGAPFDMQPHEYANLMNLSEIGPEYRLMLDQPRWFLRDGLLALSLWQGNDRIYSLAFLFGTRDDERIVYIGGIQGRRGESSLERYRALTKKAHGLRPADLLIELFRMMCLELGVTDILAVSDATRHQRGRYYTSQPGYIDPVTFDYDAIWRERGGRATADGFFRLPLQQRRRREADVPARKRTLYRKRHAMLAILRERLAQLLSRPERVHIDQHEPAWL